MDFIIRVNLDGDALVHARGAELVQAIALMLLRVADRLPPGLVEPDIYIRDINGNRVGIVRSVRTGEGV